MKKTIISVAAVLAVGVTSASAADLPAKVYSKAPPIVAFDPWDIAFGAAVMSNYVFRGVSQSNNNPSVNAYFEPRYNVTKDLQLYVGTSWSSISFANRAAAEVDIYGGIRPTFGAFAFDFGVYGYLYPGGKCVDTAGVGAGALCPGDINSISLANGNVLKKDLSFYEGYAKVNWTVNDMFTIGANEYYTPSFLNSGAWGNYASLTAKFTAPTTVFGPSGVGMYVSGEFGRQWLGTSDSFYGLPGTIFANGIKYKDYNTWNVGVGFNYRVFTLDLRYSDTDLSKADCNAFTSDYTATLTGDVSPINPGGFGSKWCGATFIAKLSADVTLQSNIK
ncbi:TorF family putative porin [Rhodopseudomonas pseudopalustris]|uniref:Porin n=2 Tax=Rhodopseudomonas TaxID=1073 RepID=Q130Y7_RHOPS|nr:TorF family putative porin [Rhodopseudomonas pseudopalustris]ABE41352.1 conserved hypothetical protein [Rhodopseudomonas palustris BisB5]MBB1093573.1 hypothetical protein [Rhodopseudomonas palustris]SEO03611.1 conserved hypothetical protein [Rhodopseudomonas pseudopalustris]